MSYSEQVGFLQKQIDEEQNQSVPDWDAIDDWETSLSQARKMARYQEMNVEYEKIFQEYTKGKANISKVISTLEEQINKVNDPEQLSKMQDTLTDLYQQQYKQEQDIIDNRIKLAIDDQSESEINKMIKEIETKKTQAIADGVDTSNYDLQIQNLKQSLVTVSASTKGLDLEKQLMDAHGDPHLELQHYMDYVNTASDQPYTDPKTKLNYPSEKDYWNRKLQDFVAQDFFKEWEQFNQEWVDVVQNANTNGWIPNAVPENIMKIRNDYLSDPVMAPWANKIEASAGAALDKIAELQINSILATAIASGEYDKARDALATVTIKTGNTAYVNNALNNLEKLQIQNEGQKVMSAKQLEELQSLGIPLPPQMTETAGVEDVLRSNAFGEGFAKGAALSTNAPMNKTEEQVKETVTAPTGGTTGTDTANILGAQTGTTTPIPAVGATPTTVVTGQPAPAGQVATVTTPMEQQQPLVQNKVFGYTVPGAEGNVQVQNPFAVTQGAFTSADLDALNSFLDQGRNLVTLDQNTLQTLSQYYNRVPGIKEYVEGQVGKGSVKGKAVDAINAQKIKQIAANYMNNQFQQQNPNFDITKQEGYQQDTESYNKKLRQKQGRA